ncbi:hypothetical protein Pla144_02920 [Bythopirellula polymerisocia]|uniref:Uncharacterized protein n=1 Tax=Bythopirellula polymerisocia TaxID=2528003 RepID=A0A5C6D110_9BACT|nr:hypothetical protein Pla144_02920 [Bythopirellula polymerisocia]
MVKCHDEYSLQGTELLWAMHNKALADPNSPTKSVNQIVWSGHIGKEIGRESARIPPEKHQLDNQF